MHSMKNIDNMTITMTRSEVIRIEQALRFMIRGFKEEILSPDTTDPRRSACVTSLRMWEEIAEKVDAQFDAQDDPT